MSVQTIMPITAGLRRFVLVSGRWRLPRALYWALYRAALFVFVSSAKRRFPAIEEVELRRGLTEGHWTPGVSDIDLRVLVGPVEDERAFLKAFWRHYALMKSIFPMLGEAQIVTPREAAFVHAWGGARERGKAHAAASAPAWRTEWERLQESLFSCLFLLQHTYFDARAGSSADSGHKIFKGYLDASRFAAASQNREPVLGRGRFLDERAPAAIQDRLRRPETLTRGDARDLCCASLQSLEQVCGVFVDSVRRAGLAPVEIRSPAWKPSLANSDLFAWRSGLRTLENACFPRIHGFYYDSMFRWLVVADVSDRAGLGRLFEELERWHREDPLYRGVPAVLSPSAFQVLLWTSYLETPLLYASLSPDLNALGLAARQRSAHPLVGWGQRAQWRMRSADFMAPPKLFFEWSLAHSISSLALSVRLFGLSGWAGDNAYRVAFLYSRLMSAQLLKERGLALDPEDMDTLIEVYGREFPEAFAAFEPALRESLRQPVAQYNELSPEVCFERHYPAYRLMLDRLLAS